MISNKKYVIAAGFATFFECKNEVYREEETRYINLQRSCSN
jgi:hypothetical protein